MPFTLVFKDLAITFHDFLQQGALREALKVLFVASYMALNRVDNIYKVEVHGVEQKMPNNRLKSAHVMHFNIKTTSQPAIPSGTTSGSLNRVRFPDYLVVQLSLQRNDVANFNL